MITRQEITKLAELARIKLNDSEKTELAKDMEAILDYFKKLQELEIKDDAAGETSALTENLNELREDEYFREEGLFSEDLLKQVPDREKRYIKVKRILN